MNWKLVILGGLIFYVAMFVVSFATAPLIHEGVLDAPYRAHSEFWRPELNQDPPDMAALMPRWIATGLFGAFVLAAVYGKVRSAFSGPGWKKGMTYGFLLTLIIGTVMMGWSGVFNLPGSIWAWWALESLIYYLVGGAVLGWFAERFAPA